MQVKVGDVLAGSWGYSMTLWSFVKVIKVTPKQVVLQELKSQALEGPEYHRRVVPLDQPDPRGTTFRFQNNKPDYIWNPKYRCLYRQYFQDKECFENRMD